MNLLDMRTVLLSYMVSTAICAAVLASLWWQNRRCLPERGFWLVDFIMQFTTLVLVEAEANGGRIEVQSEPGAGSTFTLCLPGKEVARG